MNRRDMADEEDYEESESLLSRLKKKFGLDDEGEEEEDDAFVEADSFRRPSSAKDASRTPTLRVHTPRPTEISVWVSPRTLNDAQSAADKLKERRSVLINLENTDDDIARRVIDFISGVTYALDGYYQRVGNKVFLFTPSNTVITVEDDLDQEQRTLFFEQD